MKILLINPPFERLKKNQSFNFPIGLGYLSSFLKRYQFEPMIYNADAPEKGELHTKKHYDQFHASRFIEEALNDPGYYVWREIDSVFDDYRPDMIGISLKSVLHDIGLKIARMYKRRFKNGIVVIGGPHAAVQPEILLEYKEIDFVVSGEGEVTLLELCQMVKYGRTEFENIRGLTFRRKGKIVKNEPRELIQDLDDIPFPDRESFVFPERHRKNTFGAVITSRGCPYGCYYCAARCTWGNKVRNRSVGNVMKEIEQIIIKYESDRIAFWDDSFTSDRERTLDFCDGIVKDKLNFRWSCTTRVDLVDSGLLKKMNRAGCIQIDYGIESGSDRVLKQINKGISTEQVEEALALSERNHILAQSFFMVGFPDETLDDIEETIRFIKRIKHSSIYLSIFTPYPGTRLYERAKELGLIPPELRWCRYSHQSIHSTFTVIPEETFKQIVTEIGRTIDRHNKSCSVKKAYYSSMGHYYKRHPGSFVKKMKDRLIQSMH